MSLNISNLSYKGLATIKIVKGNKIVKTISAHNEGKPLLFKALASALCGFDISNTIPKYMQLGNLSDGVFYSRLTNSVPVNGRVVENESIFTNDDEDTAVIPYGAMFTAYVPSSSILGSDVNSLQISSDYQSKSPLALIKLNQSQQDELVSAIQAISGSYSIIIEWLMMVYNNVDISILSDSQGE